MAPRTLNGLWKVTEKVVLFRKQMEEFGEDVPEEQLAERCGGRLEVRTLSATSAFCLHPSHTLFLAQFTLSGELEPCVLFVCSLIAGKNDEVDLKRLTNDAIYVLVGSL